MISLFFSYNTCIYFLLNSILIWPQNLWQLIWIFLCSYKPCSHKFFCSRRLRKKPWESPVGSGSRAKNSHNAHITLRSARQEVDGQRTHARWRTHVKAGYGRSYRPTRPPTHYNRHKHAIKLESREVAALSRPSVARLIGTYAFIIYKWPIVR